MTFDAEKVYQELYPRYHGRVRRNEPLSRHGTFGVGGPADVWVTLETSDEVLDLVSLCMANEWPLLLVGNGTNVLYADAGARGVVARGACGRPRHELQVKVSPVNSARCERTRAKKK